MNKCILVCVLAIGSGCYVDSRSASDAGMAALPSDAAQDPRASEVSDRSVGRLFGGGYPTSGSTNATSILGVPIGTIGGVGSVLTVAAGPALQWEVPASGVMLSSTTPAGVSTTAGAVGVGTTAARSDHTHLLPIVPLALGGFGADVSAGQTNGYYAKIVGGALTLAAILAGDLPTGIDVAKLAAGTVSNTVFGYLANVTSDIQAQLNGKQATLTLPMSEANGGFGASVSGIGTGLFCRSATNTPLARSIVAGTGTTVTNGTCAAGNPAVNVTYGTSSSTATQGNDTRLPPAPGTTGSGLYDNGSAWQRLAIGTSGQTYAAGAGGFPQWESRPAVVVSGQTVGALPSGVSYLVARGAGLATSGTSGFLSVGTRSSMRAKNLYCTGSSLVAGSNIVIAMYTGAGASVLTCTITEPSVSCNDTTHNPAVSAGNGVNIQVTSSTTQGAGYALTCAFDINIGVG